MFLSANIHGTNIFMLRIEHALEKRTLMGLGEFIVFMGVGGAYCFFLLFSRLN